jgi:hypothetical protein
VTVQLNVNRVCGPLVCAIGESCVGSGLDVAVRAKQQLQGHIRRHG